MPAFRALERTYRCPVDKNSAWKVPERLTFLKKVGSGAYGSVVGFHDAINGRDVAVKKVEDAFKDLVDAKRILREIKVLRQLKHDNIISIMEMFPPESPDFEDIYIVSELMETDLHRVIYSKQELTEEHLQYFIYQMLRGILYLHSANVLHRDLKPSNILVNLNCDLKICDFGLARGLGMHGDQASKSGFHTPHHHPPSNPKPPNSHSSFKKQASCGPAASCEGGFSCSSAHGTTGALTDYVVTRWYRAPEIILHSRNYCKPVDIWSVGCIFAEMLGRKALFAGQDHLDQLAQVVKVIGTPQDSDLQWLVSDGTSNSARRYLDSLPRSAGVSLEDLYPSANPLAINLLKQMLALNPEERITVQDSLRHPYLESLYMNDDEPLWPHSKALDWSFDNFRPTKRVLQNRVYTEVASFYPEIMLRDVHLLKSRSIAVPQFVANVYPELQPLVTHQPIGGKYTGSHLTRINNSTIHSMTCKSSTRRAGITPRSKPVSEYINIPGYAAGSSCCSMQYWPETCAGSFYKKEYIPSAEEATELPRFYGIGTRKNQKHENEDGINKGGSNGNGMIANYSTQAVFSPTPVTKGGTVLRQYGVVGNSNAT